MTHLDIILFDLKEAEFPMSLIRQIRKAVIKDAREQLDELGFPLLETKYDVNLLDF